jgi:glycosyltransferase involved in cell wall biosynthesis
LTELKIVLLIASSKGEMCGVADYTERLAVALADIGADVHLELIDRWSFSDIFALRRRYAAYRRIVFHMQYPSLHLGKSVAPGFLPFMLPNSFVTLHEFRLFNIVRKWIFVFPALFSKGIIFSNDAEKGLFQSYFPFSKARLYVLPIGNNIARVSSGPTRRGAERVVYFGQISRNKGIEFFLDTISELRTAGVPVEAELIGALVETDATFVEMIRSSVSRLGIRLRLNLPPTEVSVALSEATLALLPFPDGVSNKRGSALACLDHGLTVLTTHTALTPEWLAMTTHRVATPKDAAVSLSKLVSGETVRIRSPEVIATELRARDWHEIAREHLALYERSFTS